MTISLFLTLLVQTTTPNLPHMDLEMTGEEYARMIRAQRVPIVYSERSKDLDVVMKLGERNLNWLKFINDHRPAGQKLSFSSPQNTAGIPITSPRKNSPKIVMQMYEDLKAQLPASMKTVLMDGQAFTEDVPLAEQDYLAWGFKVDRAYQSASRWLLQEPYLWVYASRIRNDIRGYYDLMQISNLQWQLKHYAFLTVEEKARIEQDLKGVCLNFSLSSSNRCLKDLEEGVDAGDLSTMYSIYAPISKQIFDGMFQVKNPRGEMEWNASHPATMLVPFKDPGTAELRDFFKINVEDEWRYQDWALLVNFKTSGSNLARMVFEAGATPHVNGLGGDTITMDANVPLTEYMPQWTIRHEFGHVLGFPDCYVEFYDETEEVMINYQVDIENLMCSRKGHILQTHYDELKKAYYQ